MTDPPQPPATPPKRRRKRLTKRAAQTLFVSSLAGRVQQLVDEQAKPLGKRAAAAAEKERKRALRAKASKEASELQGYALTEDGEVIVTVEPREPLPVPPRQAATRYRVAYLRELMARGEYAGHETKRRLAVEWGVSLSTIGSLAAEASRSLALDPEDLDAAKRQHGATARKVLDLALSDPHGPKGGLDGRVLEAALKANEQWAKFRGIDIDRKQVEVTGKDGAPFDATGGLAGLFAALAKRKAETPS